MADKSSANVEEACAKFQVTTDFFLAGLHFRYKSWVQNGGAMNQPITNNIITADQLLSLTTSLEDLEVASKTFADYSKGTNLEKISKYSTPAQISALETNLMCTGFCMVDNYEQGVRNVLNLNDDAPITDTQLFQTLLGYNNGTAVITINETTQTNTFLNYTFAANDADKDLWLEGDDVNEDC